MGTSNDPTDNHIGSDDAARGDAEEAECTEERCPEGRCPEGDTQAAAGSTKDIVTAQTITPDGGSILGQQDVVIHGTNLRHISRVSFADNDAPRFTSVNSTTLNVVTPGGTADGPVDVVVHTDYGTKSNALTFTYRP